MPFPRKETEINALLQIWKLRIPDYAAQYGLTTAQVEQEADDATLYNHLLAAVSQFEADKDELYTYKNNASEGDTNGKIAAFPTITLSAPPAPEGAYKPGIVKRSSELYNFLKNHPNRTAESLADLGITNTAKPPVPPESLKPTLKGGALANDKVEIKFARQGQKVCRIQRRRNGGDWENVGDPDYSPFVDDAPSVGGKPEKREYRGIYLQKNNPVGQYSDIIVVVTTP